MRVCVLGRITEAQLKSIITAECKTVYLTLPAFSFKMTLEQGWLLSQKLVSFHNVKKNCYYLRSVVTDITLWNEKSLS